MIFITKNIKYLLSRKKKTQAALAEALGVEQASISGYTKDTVPRLDKIAAVARFFDVTIDTLVTQDLARGVPGIRPGDEAHLFLLVELSEKLRAAMERLQAAHAEVSKIAEEIRAAAKPRQDATEMEFYEDDENDVID